MKKELYYFCEDYVASRIERIHGQIQEIKASLTSESKRTAGDKHETGRAMLQLEREKLGQQLSEAEKMQQLLRKVPIEIKRERVALGSMVKTDRATYYVAISAGKYETKDTIVFCISANTPIAKLLLGKTIGETYIFNGITSKIIAIS